MMRLDRSLDSVGGTRFVRLGCYAGRYWGLHGVEQFNQFHRLRWPKWGDLKDR